MTCESHGRSGVGQGVKVPVLFLKISPPIRIISVSIEGGWEGLSTKASDPSRANAPLYAKKSLISWSIRNLWRKRPFSEAWKSFELLRGWQTCFILKAGESTSANIWPPPPIFPPSHGVRPLMSGPGKRQWPWAESGVELKIVVAFCN